MRGTVVDPDGKPLADVKVEFTFQGESRVKIVKSTKTDKKGGWVRVGLQSGNWKITFTKPGYKPFTTETWTGGDSLSELPQVTLAAAPEGQKTPTSAAEAEAQRKEKEEAKKLGDTYAAALEAMHAGDNAKAEALFKEVLAANPMLAEAHHNLGYVYMLENNADGAEAEFRKAIEANPSKADSYTALATLLTARGKGEEGYELLQNVAGLFPLDGKFQFALGVAASNVGKDEEARAAFEKAADLDPGNAESQYYLGTLAIGRNEVPKAIEYLKAYVAAAPEGTTNLATAKALLETLEKKK
jgi:tetratricopeptide (TPR) repeat protein